MFITYDNSNSYDQSRPSSNLSACDIRLFRTWFDEIVVTVKMKLACNGGDEQFYTFSLLHIRIIGHQLIIHLFTGVQICASAVRESLANVSQT